MFLAGLEINIRNIKKIPRKNMIKAINFLVLLSLLTPIIGHFIFQFNYIITVALPLISVGLLRGYIKRAWKR